MKNIFVLILMFGFISCSNNERKLPFYNSADFTPRWETPDDDTFHKIREFDLVDQNGSEFTEKDIEGKISVADFFFTTCPGICPKMTKSMSALQQEFISDNEVQLLSHSVTPDKDSVSVLSEYAKDNGVNYDKWKLLTGDKSEIYDLGRKYYYIEEDLGVNSDTSIFLHTENFVLIDKDRHIRGIYNGLDKNSMTALSEDIKVLKQED